MRRTTCGFCGYELTLLSYTSASTDAVHYANYNYKSQIDLNRLAVVRTMPTWRSPKTIIPFLFLLVGIKLGYAIIYSFVLLFY